MTVLEADGPIEKFIKDWRDSSGAERANFQPFLGKLCELLGVAPPDPSGEDASQNSYAFERSVDFKSPDGKTSKGRIDLYKKDCFVLEAKQSRMSGGKKALANQSDLFVPDANPRGTRQAGRAWDTLMMNARKQAEDYAKALPQSDGWPPFILVCDVGHCIEVYADFTGQGKNYSQFPDRNGYRIYMEDLRDEKIRNRLQLIWQDPHKLDPTKRSARVTRDISKRLAGVSRRLEERGYNAEDVSLFLMRCLFTMFAEDVKLLPEGCFTKWLERAQRNADQFKHELAQLWQAMDKGGYATIAESQVKRFNGSFFKSASMLDLRSEEIGELLAAAKADWKEVDPAIFGTLLEQALDKEERARLGAHYTPRAYVERLVVVTVMEPLRQDWAQVQATVERLRGEKRDKEALQRVRDFHHKLCTTRVLDPACGTGNFLYVALELMKKLENDVLEAVVSLGSQEGLAWMDYETVGPQQFLGLELNPRAARIAELVVWLGYLQLHYRSKPGHPPEPILDDFGNIQQMDAVLTWDGYPVPKVETKDEGKVETYPNARRPDWPEAEFIVGNPPFIGGKDIRERLGDAYAKALWDVHKQINNSADFVMYWWDRAAEIVAKKGSKTQRFGFVTTNSITQTFSRRSVARHLSAKRPISLLLAIPDHPWTKASQDTASVRIAMTVGVAGKHEGVLRKVVSEAGLDSDEPKIELDSRVGKINADLTVGSDVTATEALRANKGVAHKGYQLNGEGFIISSNTAHRLVGEDNFSNYVKKYFIGRELNQLGRNLYVLDFFPLTQDELRSKAPQAYQHLLEKLKSERENNRIDYRRDNWWLFGQPSVELRSAQRELGRIIVTARQGRHRLFSFATGDSRPESTVVAICSDDAFVFGVVHSSIHEVFSLKAGGWLGAGNDTRYFHTKTFDPFPFPDCDDALKARIRTVAEELDAHRKARQAEHPDLTLTQMYNVLEKLRTTSPSPRARGEGRGEGQITAPKPDAAPHPLNHAAPHALNAAAPHALNAAAPHALNHAAPHPNPLPIKNGEKEWTDKDEKIKQDGLVLILKELHENLDALVFEAYGWPADLSDDDILEHLVVLNKKRALEEKTGKIRWLRSDYQIPRFGDDAEQARLANERRDARAQSAGQQDQLGLDDDPQVTTKPRFPTGDELAETAAVMRVLAAAQGSLSIDDIAGTFSQGARVDKRIALTIQALARLGHIAMPDAADRFALRESV